MFQLSLDQLKKISPRMGKNPITASKYIVMFNDACTYAEINTELRVAAFLAQVLHESCELKYMREIWDTVKVPQQLKYERPMVNGVLAPLVNPPDKIPLWQRLGNLNQGDGYKYRGAGPIQLTGGSNIHAAAKDIGVDIDLHPELLDDPGFGFKGSAWFWKTHNLNTYADIPNFDKITLTINGGYTGKPERDAWYARAKAVIGV